MTKNTNGKKENKAKGLFNRLIEKLDRKMAEKAKSSNCCCSGKKNGNNSCCS